MERKKTIIGELKRHLMTGVSYLLPLIIGSSLVVAVPKLLGLALNVPDLGIYKDGTGFFHILYLMEQVGWTGIGLTNVVLGGFIAYSIGDKPAMGAGFIGGMIASNTNTGFIGAVIAGFFSGYICKLIKDKIKINNSASALMPLIVIPIITVGLTGILMSVVLAGPLGVLNTRLIQWVSDMSQNGTNKVLLAIILGAMIGFDLGGPVNKAAWMAGNVLFLEGIYLPNVFINVAILIPPLGYGIATLIKKSRFSKELFESGKGNLVMGIIGITEGAIPFTLKEPLKLVPINMLGCAVGAGVTAILGASPKMPPLGGLYGFVSLDSGWAYLVGALVGSFTIAILSIIFVDFKDYRNKKDEDEEIVLEIL